MLRGMSISGVGPLSRSWRILCETMGYGNVKGDIWKVGCVGHYWEDQKRKPERRICPSHHNEP